MKYVFIVILFIHALIHLLGFGKAFGFVSIPALPGGISKQEGVCWFITGTIMITAALLFWNNGNAWLAFAFLAILVSQGLIMLNWRTAKYGSLINLMALVVVIIHYAHWSFKRMVKKEVVELLQTPVHPQQVITEDKIASFPPVVQQWLHHSGIIGKPDVSFIRLKQKGMLRFKPAGKWMEFNAEEYFSTEQPSFNWQTKVNMMPLIYMDGRDKYVNGDGEMLVKLLAVKPVINVKGSYERNQAALIRYLSEICWFPSAAISEYINWEPIDTMSARAFITYHGITVSGVFYFTAEGDIYSFEALRYGDFNGETSLEKWHVQSKEYKVFHGIRVPSKSEVTWKLDTGNFTWLKLELDTVDYNKAEIF